MKFGKLFVDLDGCRVIIRSPDTTVEHIYNNEAYARAGYDRITAYLSEMIETALEEHAQKTDQELINGTGTGTPTGLLHDKGGE